MTEGHPATGDRDPAAAEQGPPGACARRDRALVPTATGTIVECTRLIVQQRATGQRPFWRGHAKLAGRRELEAADFVSVGSLLAGHQDGTCSSDASAASAHRALARARDASFAGTLHARRLRDSSAPVSAAGACLGPPRLGRATAAAARDLRDLRAEPPQPHIVQPHRLAAASGGRTTRTTAGQAGRASVLAALNCGVINQCEGRDQSVRRSLSLRRDPVSTVSVCQCVRVRHHSRRHRMINSFFFVLENIVILFS